MKNQNLWGYSTTRYSLGFKESQIKKVLPPLSRLIKEVAQEAGISDQTLLNWLSKAKEGTLVNRETVRSAGRSPREKFYFYQQVHSLTSILDQQVLLFKDLSPINALRSIPEGVELKYKKKVCYYL